MAERHPVLYDVERWRRYRTILLLPATVFLMTAALTTLLKPQAGGGFGYAMAAAVLLAIAASLWTRSRFTYLARDGEALVIRSLASSARLSGADIERARLVRLSSVYSRADRRHLLPRPTDRWLSMEALSLTLSPASDTRGVTKALGARCLVDGTLVVPVAGQDGLLAELLQHVCPPVAAAANRPPRRRGRRR